jgi:hypothetical protein
MNISTKSLEYILIIGILIMLSLTFKSDPKPSISNGEFIIDQEEYEKYPLIAWQDIHEKWDGNIGDIVTIKYRVFRHETKLWMYDRKTGRLVHEQPLLKGPLKNGNPRDVTYVWKLYKTERSEYIPPGEYDIVIAGAYEPISLTGKLAITIETS